MRGLLPWLYIHSQDNITRIHENISVLLQNQHSLAQYKKKILIFIIHYLFVKWPLCTSLSNCIIIYNRAEHTSFLRKALSATHWITVSGSWIWERRPRVKGSLFLHSTAMAPWETAYIQVSLSKTWPIE